MHLKELDANLIVVLDALLIDASVTKAAERLGRSPSAVSHALSNLRHIFDDALFVRAGQRLTPTARAKELAPTIHIIVSGLESLLRPTTPFDATTVERQFVIQAPPLAEVYLLHPLSEILRLKAPNIILEQSLFQTGQMVEELRNARCDFVILEGPHNDEVKDISWQLIKRERFLTFTHKKNERAKKKIELKDLKTAPHFISLQCREHSMLISQALERHKISPAMIKPVASSMTAVLLSLESPGFVTIPEHHAEVIAAHLPIKQVELPFTLPPLEVHLGWHRSLERDECHQWLKQQILSVFNHEEVLA